jgi:hypothetical protein
MKTIAIILGLTAAALAQIDTVQPAAAPTPYCSQSIRNKP